MTEGRVSVARQTQRGAQVPALPPKSTVLLIEDSPAESRLYSAMVSSESFSVVCADRLASGLDRLSKGDIDLILLDLTLPDRQGVDTFAAIHERAPELPIILLTGHDDGELATEALKSGAEDYLVKGKIDAISLHRSLHYALERKRAAQSQQRKKLKEAHLELAAIVDSSYDAVIGMRVDGTIRSWNKAATSIFGYTKAEMTGSSLLRLVLKEQVLEMEAALEQVKKRKKAELRDTIGVRKDGTKVHISIALSPILDAESAIIGASAVVRDITDRVSLELQRQDVISTLTHDVRSTILSQKRIADLLAANAITNPEELQQLFLLLSSSTDSVLSKVSNLVNVCKYSVRSKQDFERIDLSMIADQCVRERVDAMKQKGITCKTRYSQESKCIVGDPNAMKAAIDNILENAIKFTPSGGKIEVAIENGNPGVEIRITDTGIGISREGRENLFERFWQGDAGRSESGGTGFGLYLCSQIIQGHGGTISCLSKPNGGTTMTMRVPMASDES